MLLDEFLSLAANLFCRTRQCGGKDV